MKILIVEDDIKISAFLQKGLEEEKYIVDTSYDGSEALYLIELNKYDLILLDIMIPSINGIELCIKIREKNIDVPIIILSAKGSIEDKINGLDIGANDYISKPFSFDELSARIRVQLRKNNNKNNILAVGDLSIDLNSKIVKRKNNIIELTLKEYILLEYLIVNKDTLVSEDMINEALWDMQSQTSSNIISVYMYRLRNKINKGYETQLIHTIRGRGYKISDKD